MRQLGPTSSGHHILRSCFIIWTVLLFICDARLKGLKFPQTENHDEGISQEIQERGTRGGNPMLPEEIDIELQTNNELVRLHLVRNHDIDLNVPIVIGNSSEELNLPKIKNIGFYWDNDTLATVMVEGSAENGQITRKIIGNFNCGDTRCYIEPVDDVEEEDDRPEPFVGGKSRARNKNKRPRHKVSEGSNLQNGTRFKTPAVDHKNIYFNPVVEQVMESNGSTPDYHSRVRRADEIANYDVEMVFIMDHTIWEWILDIADNDEDEAVYFMKYYYGLMVNAMQLAYHTIDSRQWGFRVTPWLKKYHVMKTEDDSWFTVESITRLQNDHQNTHIDADTVLQNMARWSVSDGRGWGNPDHSMFWTRYNLDGNNAVGYAYLGTICAYGLSVSIIEDLGSSSWSTATHELAHSLGASHDGQGNDCLSSDLYIMESGGGFPDESNVANTFTFSSCSIEAMRGNVEGSLAINGLRFPRVCLMNQVCTHDEDLPDVEVPLGEVYTADEQCKLVHGDNSYNCQPIGEETCILSYCQSFYQSTWSCWGRPQFVADGTPCGNGKICQKSVCVNVDGDVENQLATPASPDCEEVDLERGASSGCDDTPNWVGSIDDELRNCEDMVRLYPQFCTSWDHGARGCCESCSRAGLRQQTVHLVDVEDGRWTSWSSWSQCSVTCGRGEKTRTRSCTNPAPAYGGDECTGDDTRTSSCDAGSCDGDVDGGWSTWGNWGSCSRTCNSGERLRTRTCNDPTPRGDGRDCSGSERDSGSCNRQDCPVDGDWGSWGRWGSCSRTCGSGSRSRTRECNDPSPEAGGDPCTGSDTKTGTCDEGDCPVDGSWSSWGSWSSCSRTCGAGVKRRDRDCDDPEPQNGGDDCSGSDEQTKSCEESQCAVDGDWSSWGSWSSCSRTCGAGVKRRDRDCDDPQPQNGGDDCSGSDEQTKSCEGLCEVDKSDWEAWSEWSQCSVTCGRGQRNRQRTCASDSNDDCEGSPEETVNCTVDSCEGRRKTRWSCGGRIVIVDIDHRADASGDSSTDQCDDDLGSMVNTCDTDNPSWCWNGLPDSVLYPWLNDY